MRNRTTMFLVFALLLFAFPAYQSHRAFAACTAQQSPPSEEFMGILGLSVEQTGSCASEMPSPPPFTRGLGILGAFCFAAFLISLGINFVDRRREHDLLQAAGINVREGDLPLED